MDTIYRVRTAHARHNQPPPNVLSPAGKQHLAKLSYMPMLFLLSRYEIFYSYSTNMMNATPPGLTSNVRPSSLICGQARLSISTIPYSI
jgi:hypothetical protein